MARKTKKIPVRDEFLIVTNGKRSEKDYFEILRSKIKSIYKIKVKFINGDPDPFMTERSHFERFCKRPFGKTSKVPGPGQKGKSALLSKERSFSEKGH